MVLSTFMAANLQKVFKSGNFYIRYFWFTFVFMNNMVSLSYERRVIPDIEIRDAVIKACGLRSISDFQLLTLERRKSVIQEVMRSLDVRPRQLSRVTGMNYETIRNIEKNCHENRRPYPGAPMTTSKHHPDEKKRKPMTSVSLFSSLGNWHPYPGA